MTSNLIEQTLMKLKTTGSLPSPVSSWRVEMGPDAADEPAAWVWVTLEDTIRTEERAALRELIREAVLKSVPDLSWAYVRFRAASEGQKP